MLTFDVTLYLTSFNRNTLAVASLNDYDILWNFAFAVTIDVICDLSELEIAVRLQDCISREYALYNIYNRYINFRR